MEAVRAENLYKTYGHGATEVKALVGVSMVAHAGEVVALLGPSGSGKSTLLTGLGLLNPPEKGSIDLMGERVLEDGRACGDLAALRRSRIGFVFQKSNLIPFLSAHENVRLILALNDQLGAATHSRAQELLEYLGVGNRSLHFPEELSGGEQQRVAIARALAPAPPLILADEPTAALDSQRAAIVMDLLIKVAREQHAAVLVVSHDEKIYDRFDRMVRVRDGVLESGSA